MILKRSRLEAFGRSIESLRRRLEERIEELESRSLAYWDVYSDTEALGPGGVVLRAHDDGLSVKKSGAELHIPYKLIDKIRTDNTKGGG